MQRLVRLQITPIDHDQRLGHAGEQLPRQRRVDPLRITLQMHVAQQPVGPLDAMAQLRPAAEASADLGQRQPWAAHGRRHRFEQHGQAPTVDADQQRRDTAL